MKERSANPSNSSSNSDAKSNAGGKDKNAAKTGAGKVNSGFDGMLPGPEVGVLLLDEKRKIVTANDVSAAIFGTPDLAGKDIGALLKGGLNNEFGRALQQRFQAGKGTQRFSFDVTGLCKGGSSFPASVILTRNSVGNKMWWTALFRKLEDENEGHSHDEILKGATDELQKHCLSMVAETTSYREEVEALQIEKDELSANLEATQISLGDLEKKVVGQTTRIQELEKTLKTTQKELEDARSGTALRERDVENEIAQNERLKEEVVALRQMCDDLTEKLSAEQLSSSETAFIADEWRKELETVGQAEAEWQAKFEAASQELVTLKEQQAEGERYARESAEELEGLRQTLQELEAKRVEDQKSLAEAQKRGEALEAELQEKNEELEAAEEELEKCELDGAPEDWMRDLVRLREAEASFQSERSDLEHRLRESVSSLARTTADLERERKERRRIEQRVASLTTQLEEMHVELKGHLESERSTQDRIFELEEQLRESRATADRLDNELRDEEAGRKLAEEQIGMAGDMKAQVENYRTLFEESKETFKQAREELEAKLQTALQSTNDLESKLRREVGDHQRAQEALANLQEQFDRNSLELSKVQSELQVERLERKQMEGDAAHSRYTTLDSARVNRAQTSTLKRQLREPVDSLLKSSRSLLDADLPDEHKQLIESLLENSLLVQSCLQESSPATVASTNASHETSTDNLASAETEAEKEESGGEVTQAA